MEELLLKLRNLNVDIKVHNGTLKLNIPDNLNQSEIVEVVKKNKDDLIKFINETNAINNLPNYIEPAKIKDNYVLTSSQKRLYFLNRFDTKSLAYNMPKAVRINGLLNKEVLASSLNKLLVRHESLRTFFEVNKNEPVQKISNNSKVEIEYFYKVNDEESIIKKFVRPFDLGNFPLFRVGLIEISKTENILIVDMHHIISDGISQNIFINDLISYYNSEELPDLKIQYKDYAEWQISDERQKIKQEHKKFWIKEFSDHQNVLELPIDFQRPAVKGYAGDSYGFAISSESTNGLKLIAEREETTLFTVVLAIYNILLNKITNQDDIVVGVPIAGRQSTDLQNIMGMFVNTLPIRSFPDGKLSFTEFLDSLSLKTLACFENQDFPYEELITDLGVKRDIGRNPLFDVMLAFHNIDKIEFEIPGLSFEPYISKSTVSKFDITLVAIESGGQISFDFEYSTELFKKETVEKFALYLKKIISVVLLYPGKKICDIEIISEEERNKVLNEFNDTTVAYQPVETVIDLFDRQVKNTPENIAVKIADKTISYKEISTRTGAIANHLLTEMRIQKGDLVGVILEREEYLIPAIFGILKAGGAYVPIDPNYPSERINTIIEDSKLKIVITRTKFNYAKLRCNAIFDLDTGYDTKKIKTEKLDVIRLKPSDLAYVIYTSGSTGNPKGVMIEHHSIFNIITSLQNNYPLYQKDSYLLKTNCSFDVSMAEIFGWFLDGGSLTILPSGSETSPTDILNVVEENKITHINFVPSMFSTFVEEIERQGVQKIISLKYIFLAGEALSKNLVSRFKASNTPISLENIYGPTEGTIYSCSYSIGIIGTIPRIPIGKPLSNIKLYILNQHGNLQPPGIPGELYIGGEAVARGYLNQKELTAQKFIESPFQKERKLYKTGDLAMWLPDGNIDYLGRIDNQVKINGVRIELGEIEIRLMAHKDVDDAVLLKNGKEGDYNLVAYYVAKQRIQNSELREFLAQHLPSYMIPSYFVHLDKMPLNANGKLDKYSLPIPEKELVYDYVPPKTDKEKLLAAVWSKVLDVKKIGITDNFFLMGGDSIKSIQICSRVRTLNYEITVKDIFTYQTIQQLALNLKQLGDVSNQSIIEGKSTLSPIQQWFFSGPVKNKNHYNQSVMLKFKEQISIEKVKTTFKKITEHHDALRLVFKSERAKTIQHNMGIGLAFHVDEFYLNSNEKPDQEILLIAEKLHSSIDLENGPLMKIGLFHFNGESRLLIIVHHLVIDGISWRILFEDIESLFMQIDENKNLSLPLKTDAFLLWPDHLSEYAKTTAFGTAKKYWSNILSRQIKPIISNNKLNKYSLRDVKTASFKLSKINTNRLLSETHIPFNTHINDILLSALFLSFKNQFNIESVKIDLEGHGRENLTPGINISRTVGWFTSIYPVILESQEKELSVIIKEIKEILRKIPNNGVDYLIQKFALKEDDYNGIKDIESQICFNYLGQFDSDIKGNSFTIAEEEKGKDISLEECIQYEFDITCIVINGQLEVKLKYCDQQNNEFAVKGLMDFYNTILNEIISYCHDYGKTELTPHDLTYKNLTIDQLNYLASKYDIKDIYPLSPMQEGMLFHSLLDKDSGAYFGQTNCQIKGNLNINFIAQSFTKIVEWYDILRTVFLHEVYDRQIQIVLKERPIDFVFVDIRGECKENEKQEVIQNYKNNEKSKPFDLRSDILMRLLVLQSDEDEFEFIWSHHHVIMDGWCMGIIINDFKEIYSKIAKNQEIATPVISPYSNYINWLEKRERKKSESYWKQYLKGYDNAISFPKKEMHKSKSASFNIKKYELEIDKDETKLLYDISSAHSVTINTLFQGLWAIVLSKYNNANDVVFGSVVSGRPSEIDNIETMVGLFINTIPIRITYNPDDFLLDVIKDLQIKALEIEQHHYHPLSEIQSLSELGQNLFDHIIAFENLPVNDRIDQNYGAFEKPEIPFEIRNGEYMVQTNYDLSITVLPFKKFNVKFDYNSNVYSDEVINDLAGHLKNIIISIIDNSNVRIRDISLFSSKQEYALGNKFNIDLSDNVNETIQVKLNNSFKKHSSNTAIEYKGKAFSYLEIEQKVNEIYTQLSGYPISRGEYVGIFCDNRELLICSIIATLKLRAAFMTLETTLPETRLNSMINQANCRYIITDKNISDYQSLNDNNCDVTWLPVDDISIAHSDSNSCKTDYDLEDSVYLYFTSGTTGNPKGVIGSNKGLSHFIQWEISKFNIDSTYRVSQFTNPGFDVFLRDIFVPLCSGATICIPDEDILYNGKDIGLWIDEQKISLIHCVPSFFKLFNKIVPTQDLFGHLKYILLAGEKILPFELKDWYAKFNSKIQLVNIYGPTETTLAKGYFLINKNVCDKQYIPIQPISGAQFMILDGNLKPCPKMVVGEIYIRTPYKSHGYLNMDGNENLGFVLNPFNSSSKEVIYKTGDLGRAHEYGEIEILGRLDHQIKIRGIRIELDDIKENIVKYPKITDSVIIVKEDRNSEKFICAYIVADDAIDQKELREYLNVVLPKNMVPSYFIQIKEFPLLPNGKINRKALPDYFDLKEEIVIPANKVEEELRDIWSDILNINKEEISITKNFFELGGHSIKIFHLINKIMQAFSVKLKLSDVFQNLSITELAGLISTLKIQDHLEIPKAEMQQYYVASSAQERMYYRYLLNKDSIAFNISIPVNINGTVDVDKLNRTFQVLIDRHEGLRTSFFLKSDGLKQKINEKVQFELSILPNNKHETLKDAFHDFIKPFDLSAESLIRCGLLRNIDNQNVLFIDIHHIIADGVSLNILVNEFKQIYKGEKLPPLALSYVDYACWLKNDVENLKRQKEFWLEKLSGDIPKLELPVRENGNSVNQLASVQSLEIDPELYSTAKRFSSDLNTSDFIFFLSIYYVLLSKISGSTDIIVGTDVVGRTNTKLKDIVGTFVNILPLRIEVDPQGTFIDLINQVKDCVLSSFDNQEIQFDQIVSMLYTEQDISDSPLFNVHFSFSNTVDSKIELDEFEALMIKNRKNEITQYEFKLDVTVSGGLMRIDFIYNNSLYEDSTIELFMEYYHNILSCILKNQNVKIENIEIENAPAGE